MNCYQHTEVPAVASCAQGCGRSLCPDCVSVYEPPTCDSCANAIEENVVAEIQDTRKGILIKLIINVLLLIPYIAVMAFNDPRDPMIWPIFPMIIWGFFGFRALMNGFLRITGLVVFDSLQGWGIKYIIGSVLTGMFGIFVLPVLIVIQLVQLSKVPKV